VSRLEVIGCPGSPCRKVIELRRLPNRFGFFPTASAGYPLAARRTWSLRRDTSYRAASFVRHLHSFQVKLIFDELGALLFSSGRRRFSYQPIVGARRLFPSLASVLLRLVLVCHLPPLTQTNAHVTPPLPPALPPESDQALGPPPLSPTLSLFPARSPSPLAAVCALTSFRPYPSPPRPHPRFTHNKHTTQITGPPHPARLIFPVLLFKQSTNPTVLCTANG